jgi:hypothetical protein
MIQTIQIDTSDRQQVKRFLDLPFCIYKGIPQWTPPLAMEASRMLDRQRHPFYKHSDAAFFLAMRDPTPNPLHYRGGGEVVGRICVLDNRNYNEFNKSSAAHFFLFECEDDLEASRALFDTAFVWARARGLNKIVGPKGMTALDGLGLLVKGFEHRPALGIPYNPAYYAKLVEDAGFDGEGDIVSGYLSPRTMNAEKFAQIDRMAELVQQRRGLRVARFKSRGDLRAAVPKLLKLYNGALGQSEGNVPFTEDEARTMANQIIWFADPKLIKIVFKGDGPVGFLLAYPDISAAVQHTRGRILPFGWIDLLREFKRTKWVNVNGAGILEQHRGAGGTALLFSEMRKSVIEGGFDHADLVQIGAANDKMMRELRDLGIDFYKMHRMYWREL